MASILDVGLRKPRMMHDCAITERYTVIMDLPFVFDPTALLSGEVFRMDRTPSSARLGLAPRHASSSSEIRWFGVTPCMVFHAINAYEKSPDVVVVHVCRIAPDEMSLERILTQPVEICVWTIDTASGNVAKKMVGITYIHCPQW
jgi:carotenoid cleavage dioxygenase-like enzyme